ncbi:MAG: bifunctional UDP-sugar hydrolase/5'-nucleotidase, partial [Firmicutes bacterium]|nr:bifunctional UDP-sugar hydrolase/5'-nucleotidase [Bacillota bacterium]
MKTKRIFALVLSVLLVVAMIPAMAFAEEPAGTSADNIVILATNDVHCAVDTGIGYVNLAAYKEQLKKTNKYVTLVDAGDAIQGEAIGTLSKGEDLIKIMNYLGYEFAVPGNHEFDYGMDQFLNTIVPKFGGTYLSCNFVDLATGEPVFDAYEIKTYGSRKVAYVGICTPETFTKSTPTYFQNEQGEYIYSFCQGNSGQDLYNAVQKAVDAAKNAGADYVIAVGHLGTDEASTPWTSTEVIANTTGIDAFIDGHSHSTFAATAKNKDGENVATVSTGTKLENIGKVIISEAGEVSTALVSAAEITEDDKDKAAFIAADAYITGEILSGYSSKLNEVVAYSDVDLAIADENDVRQVRSQETNLGDLCADAYRIVLDADIAFVNGGGIRTAIPKGDITY